MTASTIAQAMREMEELFRLAWYPNQNIHWPNMDFKLPEPSEVWARWRVQHEIGGQSSLANVNGQSRFDREGTIFIQVFSPLNEGVISAYNNAEIVVGAYEGERTPSGVWFRNVRINEVDSSLETGESTRQNLWYQLNVLVEFIYDQIK